MAVNCWVLPPATLGFAGVTVMEVSAALETVSSVAPEMTPRVALMLMLPIADDVANPLAFRVAGGQLVQLITVACQVTLDVMFALVPSE